MFGVGVVGVGVGVVVVDVWAGVGMVVRGSAMEDSVSRSLASVASSLRVLSAGRLLSVLKSNSYNSTNVGRLKTIFYWTG